MRRRSKRVTGGADELLHVVDRRSGDVAGSKPNQPVCAGGAKRIGKRRHRARRRQIPDGDLATRPAAHVIAAVRIAERIGRGAICESDIRVRNERLRLGGEAEAQIGRLQDFHQILVLQHEIRIGHGGRKRGRTERDKVHTVSDRHGSNDAKAVIARGNDRTADPVRYRR